MVRFFSKYISADQLTLLRIVLIPAIYIFMYLNTEMLLVVAFLLFSLACLTDYWDGLIARHTGKSTELGKLLDPIADKMLISSILILLVAFDRAPAYLTALIVVREFAVSGLRSIAAVKGIIISASSGGKLKTISQMLAVGFLILHYPTLYLPCNEIGIALLWGSTAITIWSGVKYFLSYNQIVQKGQKT